MIHYLVYIEGKIDTALLWARPGTGQNLSGVTSLL